jgi:predicted transcriptional regulator
MDKLTELRAILDQFKDELGSRNKAVQKIAEELGVSFATVEGYLNKGQAKPIPDKSLRLVKLLKDA